MWVLRSTSYYSSPLDFWKARCQTKFCEPSAFSCQPSARTKSWPLIADSAVREADRSRRGDPMADTKKAPIIRAPRGRDLSCKGWHQEAALRMLMNNLDPEVAERPE